MAARPRRGEQEPVGTGTAMRKHTFEVHSLRKGRWKIEDTCDKREAAFDLARELVESPDKESVSVVEETYDRDNVKIVDRTILEKAGRPPERPTAGQTTTRAGVGGPRNLDQFIRTILILVLAVGGIALVILAMLYFLTGLTINF